MLKILIIEKEEDLRDVIGFYLESELGAQLEFAESVSSANQVLTTSSGISCVVCDYAFTDGTAEDVIRNLRKSQSKIPFILYGAYHPLNYPTFKDHHVDGFVSKWELFEKLKGAVEAVMSDVKEAREKVEPTDYCRIRTKTVLKLGALNCDFYLKLPQNRYVRILREGDMFETQDFDRFNDMKVDYLYIKSKDRAFFLQKLAQDLLKLSVLKAESTEAVFAVASSTLEVIAELIQRFGFSEEVQVVAKANVTLAVSNIRKNPDLAPLLNNLMLNKDTYLPSHSVVLAYVCCGIASLMGWKSDMTFYKLTLASFLHDILLTNNELAMIQTLPELDLARPKFTEEEIRGYLNHPVACAQLLQRVYPA
jgi:CheY-like chemotaxis protein